MPVLQLRCPDCGHQFQSLVIEGTKVPSVWVCSQCGSREAQPVGTVDHIRHPWVTGCVDGCCG